MCIYIYIYIYRRGQASILKPSSFGVTARQTTSLRARVQFQIMIKGTTALRCYTMYSTQAHCVDTQNVVLPLTLRVQTDK